MQEFTIRFTSNDIESCKWIWESLKGSEINGIKVSAMSNGNMFKRVECLTDQLDIYQNYDLDDDEQDKFDTLELEIENTWNRYV